MSGKILTAGCRCGLQVNDNNHHDGDCVKTWNMLYRKQVTAWCSSRDNMHDGDGLKTCNMCIENRQKCSPAADVLAMCLVTHINSGRHLLEHTSTSLTGCSLVPTQDMTVVFVVV